MNRNTLAFLVIGLLAGFILGYFMGANHPVGQVADKAPAPLAAPPATAAVGVNSPAAPNAMEMQQRIFTAQMVLAKDPKNLQAWIDLGNDYFDTHQAQKAIDAYAKVLELQPRNPDILTDQGIMYRELQAYDKAIANFELANKIEPKHAQSLFNLGIVYANDLKAPDKAIKAFQRVIDADPSSAQAAKARAAIDDLKAHRAVH